MKHKAFDSIVYPTLALKHELRTNKMLSTKNNLGMPLIYTCTTPIRFVSEL